MIIAVVYIASTLVWGTTWFAIRRCIGPGGYPTVGGAAVRFAVASLLLGAAWAIGWARPGPRNARQVRALLGAGVLAAVSYACIYAAEESISGGLAAVIFGTFPLCTAIFATVGGVERVGRAALGASVLAIAGTAIIFADRLEVSRAQAVGILFVLGSVFASAAYSTLLKHVATDVNPLATTGVFLGTCAVLLGAWAAAIERKPLPWPPPIGPTVALLYLAIVGSVLVFAGYFYLLKRVKLMTVSTMVLLEPIVALAVDAVWEKDVILVPRTYVGMAIVFAGVAVSILVQRPSAKT